MEIDHELKRKRKKYMDSKELSENCNDAASCSCTPNPVTTILPTMKEVENNNVCCGDAAEEQKADPFEKPGYKIMPFVEEFIATSIGYVPKVKTKLDKTDIFSTIKVRAGMGRDHYMISPGLYCTGNPDSNSPVLVTANYKLSFDHLRKELQGIDSWILILDTIGVNVWCAAGKGTFATQELVNRIKLTNIEKLVNHKNLILPQLGATGVSSFQTKKQSGFNIIWGPIRAKDIGDFINNSMTADKNMRKVSFTTIERAVLVPVELAIVLKPAIIVFLALFVLSGIGPGFFSFSAAFERGIIASILTLTGIMAGAVFTPILLPWIYGTAFSLKGFIIGLVTGIPIAIHYAGSTGIKGVLALLLLSASLSSYLAMNFTGATPFTSPSGVEKEMRKAIPLQAGAIVLGLILWVGSGF